MNRLRTRYGNVVATVALLVAVGSGVAYAGSKISGTTIKKGSEPGNRLKKNSVTGTQVKETSLGSVPKAAEAGRAGSANSAETARVATSAGNLASGQTERGTYFVIGNEASSTGIIGGAISFPFPLASAPTAHYIQIGGIPPSTCTGSAADPQAQSGHLCVYETTATNVGGGGAIEPTSITRFGVAVRGTTPGGTTNAAFGGTWAATG
jgi:hypothetical protein